MDARRLLGCAAVLLVLLAACSGSDSADSVAGSTAPERLGRASDEYGARGVGTFEDIAGSLDAGGSSSAGYDTERAALPNEIAAADASQGDIDLVAAAPPLATGPSIIKTATVQLSIKDKDFSEAVHEATAVAERYGGYVVSTTVDDEGRSFAAATLRLPADKFGVAMGAVRGVGTVESEEISGEDVTHQVIDLEARLRNLWAQETVLLRLMNDAGTVLETIRIQDHLSGVQLEIERLRGRLRYLDDQVSFSTIFVEMHERGEGPAPKVGVLGKAWQRALDGALSVVSTAIVAVGFVIPVAILLALAALAYRTLRVRIRKVPSAA